MKLFITDKKLEELIDKAVEDRKTIGPKKPTIDQIRETLPTLFVENDIMKIVSIERLDVGFPGETTCVGYMVLDEDGFPISLPDGEILREWYLDCSRAQHRKFVDDFVINENKRKRQEEPSSNDKIQRDRNGTAS